jgi:glycosyltransferase involved in cell wall biosynthesis
MKKVLVIGQTPPPFGGQALMIQRLVAGSYCNARLYHVRMAFSKDMDDVGRLQVSKLLHPLSILARAVWLRLRHGIDVLYYPPAGPDRLPMLRDIALLLCLRRMFRHTVFHFHAAGVSAAYPRLPAFLRLLYRWSYYRPDLAIQTSSFNPDDGRQLQARSTRIVANGIEDEYAALASLPRPGGNECRLLFVGVVCETKGILVLVDAVRAVRDRGVGVKVSVVGKFVSGEFRQVVLDRIAGHGLGDAFTFTGVLTGRAKNEQFLGADIFCFPTFFESESFGLVAVEAMQFGLPVIATCWRGLQSLLTDGEEGFLIPVQNSAALAQRILELAADPVRRQRMGRAGRARYLRDYSVEKFRERMDDCFGLLTEVQR